MSGLPAMNRELPRLMDLHVDWLLQYAPETTLFDPGHYSTIGQRLGQVEGYLQGTRAAVVACYRSAEDWATRAEPWRALGDLIARIEAEFAGRWLMGPDDLARWRAGPESLAWVVVGVEGFDALVRSPADLDRLPGLWDRGVRLFQPIYGVGSVLGGSSVPGDERGLTDLGRDFLDVLLDLAPAISAPGPRPILDLAHMNPRTASDVLAWFEADADRSRRMLPIYSHGGIAHAGFSSPRACSPENLARLRALGGVVGLGIGPPFYQSAEELKAGLETAAAVPFAGRSGYEGLAIGTDFLGVDQTASGLGHVSEVVAWLGSVFDPDTAATLIQGNAVRLLDRALGAESAP